MSPVPVKPPLRARPPWDDVVFVCGRCVRRSGGEDEPSLRKWIKRALESRGLSDRIRVVESGCLDLCPKKGVVLVRGSELGADGGKVRIHRRGDDRQGIIDWLTSDSHDAG